MLKWYEQNYCNRRDWILDNLEKLNLSSQETMLCLIIDFFRTNNIEMSYDNLAAKLNIKSSEVDQMICEISSKGYLNISLKDNQMVFDLTPLYNLNFEDNKKDFKTIFDYFEETFNRPLNTTELEKLSDFIKIYSQEEILNALRSADAYKKVSIAYIETILRNNVGRNE